MVSSSSTIWKCINTPGSVLFLENDHWSSDYSQGSINLKDIYEELQILTVKGDSCCYDMFSRENSVF